MMKSLILRIKWAAVMYTLNPIRVDVNVLIGELPLTLDSVVLINHNYN